MADAIFNLLVHAIDDRVCEEPVRLVQNLRAHTPTLGAKNGDAN